MYLEFLAGLYVGVVERSGKCGDTRFVVCVECGCYLPDVLFVQFLLRRYPDLEARVFVDTSGLWSRTPKFRPCELRGFVAGHTGENELTVGNVIVRREFSPLLLR